MNNLTLLTSRRLLIWGSFLTLFSLISLSSTAQLTTAFNIKPVFNGTLTDGFFLAKYDLTGGSSAARLKFSGNYNNTKVLQNFFEDNMYYNLDKWPDAVSKKGGYNKNHQMDLSLGYEMRTKLSERAVFYYGVDLGYSNSGYNSLNNWNYAYKDPNLDLYVIQQVNTYEYESITTGYSVAPLIGLQAYIKGGFSLILESSMTAAWQRTEDDSKYDNYAWDQGTQTFYILDKPDELKEQDIPWNFIMNYTPRIDLYVAYTFGKKD